MKINGSVFLGGGEGLGRGGINTSKVSAEHLVVVRYPVTSKIPVVPI